LKNTGIELQKQDLNQSAINSQASSNLRAWVAAEYQCLREMVPGPLPSKQADALTLDMLEVIAKDIGTTRFHEMILKAIETCERRPTIATLRRIAGLNDRLDSNADALARSWELVTLIITRHIGRDGEGNAVLQSRVYRDGEVWREDPIPEIPEGVLRAVRALGGWGALSDSYPQWFGQRFQQWKELYRGEGCGLAGSALRKDC
jgi:hypothetical protein